MNHPPRVAITGVGYHVPPTVRTNDDPIFNWLRDHPTPGKDLFQGYEERRVLAPPDGPPDLPKTLADLMVPAARQALDRAGVAPGEVDVLLGDGSVGEYITPGALTQVHAGLGLPSSAWVAPIDSMAVFNPALIAAHALVETGRARNALVVCGCNWTQYVSYRTPQSVSASDGAAAAVVGRTADPSRFVVVDAETVSKTADYGAMFMAGDPVRAGGEVTAFTRPYFQITAQGLNDFQDFGMRAPAEAVHRLLRRHGIDGGQVSLISHQASRVLLDAWEAAIRPAHYLETLKTFANMVCATVPVNLAFFHNAIATDFLVLLTLGVEFQTTAVLLRRNF